MFENLNTSSNKKFRKALFAELAALLKTVRVTDDSITETKIWNEFQDIKGELYNYDVNINILIERLEKIHIPTTNPAYTTLLNIQKEFIGLRANPKYADIFAQAEADSRKQKTPPVIIGAKTATASTATTAIFQPKETKDLTTLSIKERLLLQITSIKIGSVDKSEAVRVLMSLAAPEGYNGYFIDVDKDAATKVISDGLNDFKNIDDKREEMQKRLQQALIAEIDKLIEISLSAGKTRLQIVLKTGIHYTAVDIDLIKQICFIIDAAQDFRRANLHIIGQYSKYIKPENVLDIMSSGFEFESRKINNGALQKSEHGCAIFSLHHSFSLAMLDIHDEILAKSKVTKTLGGSTINCAEWLDLPPILVCLGQSTTFISYYKFRNPEHAQEIDRLTNNNTPSYGFEKAVETFKSNLELACKTKSDSELEALITKQMFTHSSEIQRKII